VRPNPGAPVWCSGERGCGLVGMGMASLWWHKFDQSLAEARQASAIGETIGAQSVSAGAHLTIGLVYGLTGRLDESRSEFGRSFTISRSLDDVANEAAALIFGAEIPGWEARFDVRPTSTPRVSSLPVLIMF